MALVKNKTTPENRAFWEHVERVAAEVRNNPQIYDLRFCCARSLAELKAELAPAEQGVTEDVPPQLEMEKAFVR